MGPVQKILPRFPYSPWFPSGNCEKWWVPVMSQYCMKDWYLSLGLLWLRSWRWKSWVQKIPCNLGAKNTGRWILSIVLLWSSNLEWKLRKVCRDTVQLLGNKVILSWFFRVRKEKNWGSSFKKDDGKRRGGWSLSVFRWTRVLGCFQWSGWPSSCPACSTADGFKKVESLPKKTLILSSLV